MAFQGSISAAIGWKGCTKIFEQSKQPSIRIAKLLSEYEK